MKYDIVRNEILLKDVEMNSRHVPSIVELRSNFKERPLVQGVASRSGLLKLGVRLALAAIHAEDRIQIEAMGEVGVGSRSPLIEIFLTDDPQPTVTPQAPWYSVLLPVAFVTIVILVLVGATTVVKWIATYG